MNYELANDIVGLIRLDHLIVEVDYIRRMFLCLLLKQSVNLDVKFGRNRTITLVLLIVFLVNHSVAAFLDF